MIKQTLSLAIIGLKSNVRRVAMSLICIISIAIVSTVFLGLLALSDGMQKTMMQSGTDNTLLVMRQGASTELQSVLFPAEVNLLANNAAIIRDKDNRPQISAELFVSAEYKFEDGAAKSLSLRGIGAHTYSFRPNFALLTGEHFTPGLRQVLVGQAIAQKYPEIQVGKKIMLGNSEWLVTGIFADNNSVFESEIWADLNVVQSEYQRGSSIQSVRLALKPEANLLQLIETWQADPRLSVRAILEKDFFDAQRQGLTRLIRWIGYPVTFIMAIGAVVSALNTMFSIITSRQREIATQKAIGFTPAAISIALIIEATILALLGALSGIVPMYLLLDGFTAATKNAASLSQLVFNFSITPQLMLKTLGVSMLIGVVGGMLPAFKVMRSSVVSALCK
ncbi:FtsX-like permease family protein [Alteromonas sediminis]|uniref:FtsX-like permease family protein n=1 Tax=Alteromonas sediminis TaxID=2259342 RepID=A0A3N5Y0P4_9ALTE|nr:FtsX-like permease family protein [Alteromonas sediminis]RPJ67052.1 FtsX-like permease family protein [Alteromonas sediminis]